MPRSFSHIILGPAGRTTAIMLLGITSLLPRVVAEKIASLSQPVMFLFWPVVTPLRDAFVSVSPKGRRETDPEVAKRDQLLEKYKLEYYAARKEADDLRQLIKEISGTLELNPTRVDLVVARVNGVGPDLSSGLITIQAGKDDHVEKNAIAVLSGVHLLGKVIRSDSKTSVIRPVTHISTKDLQGVIMFDDGTLGPHCSLKPTGDGKLSGWVFDNEPGLTISPGHVIAPGLEVRLDDTTEWPGIAQMLVLGRIESVENSPNQVLRKVITVAPTVSILTASEVMVRIPAQTPIEPPAPATAPAPKPSTPPTKPASTTGAKPSSGGSRR